MVEIIPSILAKTKEEVLDKMVTLEPYVDRVHLDVADGIFVPNVAVGGIDKIEDLETRLSIGVHLMVSKPENHIVHWLETPADKFIFHIESTQKALTIINDIKEQERSVGIALNPKTPVSAIEEFIDQVDFVHFMTVEPGFYGGKFIEKVIDKISDFHYFYPDKPIEVDGGITSENAARLVAAGASMLVVGSYIFENNDIGMAIDSLKKVL